MKNNNKKIFGGLTAKQRRDKQNWLDFERRLKDNELSEEQKQEVIDKFNALSNEQTKDSAE